MGASQARGIVKIWQMIFYPTLQVVLGLAIREQLGARWDTAVVLLALIFFGSCTAIQILIQEATRMLQAQGYEAIVNPKRSPVTVAVPNLNQMTTDKVVIDVERMFARVLIEFPNDMTEKTWIKRGRWQQLGGGGPEQFRNILRKWEAAGIVSKRNPNVNNSPYFVSRKSALAQIAGGRSPAPLSPTAKK